MRKILRIAHEELARTLSSTGYLIIAFVFPIAAAAILLVVTEVRERSGADTEDGASGQFQIDIEGYVDQSGLITRLPANIPPDRLLAFENEEQAQQALRSGAIAAYYLIPPDIIENGKVFYVYPDKRSYLEDGQPWVMDWTLTVNLLGGDADLADRVWNPTKYVTGTALASPIPAGEECTRPGSACKSNDLIRYIPSIMAGIFFMVLMSSSSLLYNSIGTEKENRTLEVLMLAATPRQLLAGKTLGLGIAGILQTAAWLGAIYVSMLLGGSTLSLPENFVFPAGILVWGAVFFIGGFGLYASLMAGTGALVPKMKEAGMVNAIVMIPLFFGYIVGLYSPLVDAGAAPLPVVLSIFPLTAPIVMIMRLSDGKVPLWQALLSAGLTYAAAWWMLRSAADLFQAQYLLSGQPFSARRYLKAFLTGR